jgi:hypothetical protein
MEFVSKMNKVLKELTSTVKPVDPIEPIVYCNQVSQEEYTIQSKLATQAGLFEAGQQALLKQQRIKQREDNKARVIEYLNNNAWGHSSKARAFKKYVEFSEEDIISLTKQLSVAQEEFDSVNDMNEEYIKEIEDLENETELKIKQLDSRIVKLRDKCITKNKTIKKMEMVNKLILFVICLYTIAYNTVTIELLNFHIYYVINTIMLITSDWVCIGCVFCFNSVSVMWDSVMS